MRWRVLPCVVALFSCTLASFGQCPQELAKFVASDGAADDIFGWPVCLSDDVAILGAYFADANGAESGAAYIYRFDGSDWNEEARLLASDGAADDRFGSGVSLSGNVAIVGAYWDDDNGSKSGAAYVYRFDGSTWIEEHKLLASDGASGQEFGCSVSLDDDVAVVGAWEANAAYVYRFDGSMWNEEAKLLPSGGGLFGYPVSVDGDAVLLGAHTDGGTGAAYVFRFDGSTWSEEARLSASDGSNGDRYGVGVSLHGSVALIGAWDDDDLGEESGSAYVYRFNGSTWIEEAKFLASDGSAGHNFGTSVSLDADVALIGAIHDYAGSAYVYRFDGSTWLEDLKIVPLDGRGSDTFGWAVSLVGDTALIGAPQADTPHGVNSGAAYVYRIEDCPHIVRHVPSEYDTIQSAIDASSNGNLIVVAPGLYQETIDFLGKNVEIVADTGVGTGGAVIDGGGSRVVKFRNGEGRGAILDGFTITGASTTRPGGGIFIENAHPTIRNCDIIENTATSGGGVWVENGSPAFVRCDFVRNTGEVGGALNLIDSAPELVNCRILGNVATNRGGALAQSFSEPLFMNCLVVGNSAAVHSGVVSNYEGHPVFINSALSANSALIVGGIRNHGPNSGLTLTNTVMWKNFDDTGFGEDAQIGLFDGALPANVLIDYGCVEGWTGQYGGTGNVDGDPVFRFEAHPGPDETWGTADDNYGNLRLSAGSSAIDAADNTAVPPDVHDLDGDEDTGEQVPIDLDETARFFDDPSTPDTGNGTPPIVDMGPYEYEAMSVETICPDDPDDYLRQFGGVVTGDALDLCASDDVRMEILQSAQLSPLLPFIRLEYWAHSTLADDFITSVEYTVECHVSALVGGGQNPDTLRTRIKNYNTGFWELIDERGTSATTDEIITHTQATNAPDYVNAGDGEVRVRQDVWNPGDVFSPNWFLKVDLYEVTVEN